MAHGLVFHVGQQCYGYMELIEIVQASRTRPICECTITMELITDAHSLFNFVRENRIWETGFREVSGKWTRENGRERNYFATAVGIVVNWLFVKSDLKSDFK